SKCRASEAEKPGHERVVRCNPVLVRQLVGGPLSLRSRKQRRRSHVLTRIRLELQRLNLAARAEGADLVQGNLTLRKQLGDGLPPLVHSPRVRRKRRLL